MTRGDRFVLRAYSPVTTIGGGLVIDPHPARGPLRTPAGLARFAALDSVSDPLRGRAPPLDPLFPGGRGGLGGDGELQAPRQMNARCA